MNPQEFLYAIQTAKKAQAVVYDEAFTGMSSRRSMSEINNMLVETVFECRKKNLFVFIVLPSVFFLDKSIVLHRGRVLFHTYFIGEKRGHYTVYAKNKIKKLMDFGRKTLNYNVVTPDYKGRFSRVFALDVKGENVQEELYSEKKLESIRSKSAVRQDKGKGFGEKQTAQRDFLIFQLINNLAYSKKQLLEMFEKNGTPLTPSRLDDIIRDGKKTGKIK